MTHHAPGRGALPLPPAAIGHAGPPDAHATSHTPPRLSREALRLGVGLRREALAALEGRLVAACEAAAGLGDPRTCAPDARELWDRATWQRYIEAAARLEAAYGPRMRRLREEIARLERLLDLPVAA